MRPGYVTGMLSSETSIALRTGQSLSLFALLKSLTFQLTTERINLQVYLFHALIVF